MKTDSLFSRLISSKDTTSSKRIITLIMALHFIVASFTILVIVVLMMFYLPKGKADPELINLLKVVLEYDFYIILGGLGFVTTENLGNMLVQKAKNIAYANSDIGMPTADNIIVDTVNVDRQITPDTPVETQEADGDEIKIQRNHD